MNAARRPAPVVAAVAAALLAASSASLAPFASLAFAQARTSTSSTPRLAARDLLADRLWDDGRAEYSTYEGTIERYGTRRRLSARIIVVKEDMDVAQGVKADAGPVAGRTRAVLKQNLIRDFRTGTYDYHQMCSTFLDRATGELAKLAMASAEGCGITYVAIRPAAGVWNRTAHSYWDGEGDRTQALLVEGRRPLAAADALPLWLRRLDLARAQTFVLAVLPSQVGNRLQPFGFEPMKVEIVGRADRHGLPVRVRPLDVPRGGADAGRVDRYWFDPAWPHPLVRLEGGPGQAVLARVKTTRLAYWEKTAPGDERLLLP